MNFEGSADFILAAARNERVQVAVKWDKKVERIYFGTVKLSEQDKKKLEQCFDELLN